METLAPREAYDHDELGVTRRMPLVTGTMYGIGMGAFAMLGARGSLAERLATAVIIGAVSGLLFGFLFTWMATRAAKRLLDRIYAGDPRLTPPPPPGYPYRLPCGWMRTPRVAVGGVLYLGPRGMRFQPHVRNRKSDRETLVMEPLERIEIARIDVPLPGWMRIFGARTAPRVEVRWPGGRAELDVPATAATLPRLRETIDALRATSPAPEAA